MSNVAHQIHRRYCALNAEKKRRAKRCKEIVRFCMRCGLNRAETQLYISTHFPELKSSRSTIYKHWKEVEVDLIEENKCPHCHRAMYVPKLTDFNLPEMEPDEGVDDGG
jgi:hypothetical protein